MYSIGEISKLIRMSIDTLRYYDEIGLVTPHYIGENNNYRYYSEQQIKDLLFIMELKLYGFSLDAMKQLMKDKDDEYLYAACDTRLQQLMLEQTKIERSISLLKKKMKRLENSREFGSKDVNILIVDDAVFIRQILQNVFEQQGYHVIGQARNGIEGVARYQELKPDIVFMDIHMPEMDGITATRTITKKDENAKILICSAKASFAAVLKSLQAGASYFVMKPFDADYLIEEIERLSHKVMRFNQETIEALLLEEKLSIYKDQICTSQETINKLLKICTEAYVSNSIDELLSAFECEGCNREEVSS